MIVPVDPDQAQALVGIDGVAAREFFALVVDGETIAYAGVMEYQGRDWMFSDVVGAEKAPLPHAFVRSAIRGLKARGGVVYAHGTRASERLLKLIGFEDTGELMNRRKVFKWQR